MKTRYYWVSVLIATALVVGWLLMVSSESRKEEPSEQNVDSIKGKEYGQIQEEFISRYCNFENKKTQAVCSGAFKYIFQYISEFMPNINVTGARIAKINEDTIGVGVYVVTEDGELMLLQYTESGISKTKVKLRKVEDLLTEVSNICSRKTKNSAGDEYSRCVEGLQKLFRYIRDNMPGAMLPSSGYGDIRMITDGDKIRKFAARLLWNGAFYTAEIDVKNMQITVEKIH